MSFDGNGVFTALTNSFNPAVAGTAIDEGDWADTLADIVAGLTKAICKDGQSTCSAVITFAQGIQVSNAGLKVFDSNSSHYITLQPTSNVTASRVWSFDFGDAARTVTLAADLTLPADPGADRLFFWDDSAGATAYLTAGTGLTITGTTLTADITAASAAEINTGTDAAKYISPDTLAGSNFGKRVVQIAVTDPNGDVLTTGDGKAYFFIPPELNGMNLVDADAAVTTVSSSGTPTIQIRNVTDTVDMLSTRIVLDVSEKTSYTAATPPVIDAAADDVATGDQIAIDVDTAGTDTKGLTVILTFQLP